MRKITQLLFIAIIVFSCKKDVVKPLYVAQKWQNPEWENPEIFQINREEPTASFYRYENEIIVHLFNHVAFFWTNFCTMQWK